MTARRRLRGLVPSGVVAVVGSTALLAATLVAPDDASAFWTATTTAGGAGAAGTATVDDGPTPSAAVQSRSNVVVTWTSTATSSGAAATGYTVNRLDEAGTPQTVLSGCAGVRTVPTCTEVGLPDGVWTYTITPRYQSWLGSAGAESAAVRTDGTAPVNGISLGSVANSNASRTGSTVYYRPLANSSLTLVNALDDAGSGPASSTTSALAGTTTSWGHTGSTVSTPTGGPFTSNPVTWNGSTSSSPTLTVTGTDTSGNTAATTLTFTRDNVAPTGGALTYASAGTNATTIDVSVAAVADASSGVAGGTRSLQRQTATLTGTSCGSYTTTWTEVATPPTTASVQTVPLTAGLCSRYRYVFTDAVGNQTTVTSAGVVKAKSYRSTILATTSLAAYYELGDAGATDSEASFDGIRSGGTTSPAGVVGDENTATCFDGSDDFVRVPRSIGGSFSVEFWFRSTQIFGAGTQWYNGAGLVDADVAGTANDFGVGFLLGRITAGTGNPDRSASSNTTWSTDAWTHVVVTRTQGTTSTGTLRMYVNGTLQTATALTGNTALTAPSSIDLGRAQTIANYFQGCLDDVSLYTAVLTQAQVTAHYQAGNAS